MKKILIAVDLQKDFLLDSGKLNLGHDTTEYRKRVAKYIKNFEGLILVTMDHHRLNSCEFLANNPKGFPEHCVMGTEGEDLIPEIDNKKIDHYFWKHTFSSNELVRNLKSLYLENNEDSFELHFIGVCSHICVFANIAAIVNAFKEDAFYAALAAGKITDGVGQLDLP